MLDKKFCSMLNAIASAIAAFEGKGIPDVDGELGREIGVTARQLAEIRRGRDRNYNPAPDQISILATIATRRARFQESFVRDFLHCALYPNPNTLLATLFPRPPQLAPPKLSIYHNLPAAPYTIFVMRVNAFEEVMEGLVQQRAPVVLIASLGGMGKTSLAYELASRCRDREGEIAKFNAVVWVSDKEKPCTITLGVVLDHIARTLEYPGLTRLPFGEKQREVEGLLRRFHVLLIIDNYETINDDALSEWLLTKLPEPSKALVTSREYLQVFQRYMSRTFGVELPGMCKVEAEEFIHQRLKLLRLEHLQVNQSEIHKLIEVTGGNPLAIEMVLGGIKFQQQPVSQVIDDLARARNTQLFDFLFKRSWQLTDDFAHRILMAMTIFPDSASSEALSKVSDVLEYRFQEATEQLKDLALIVKQTLYSNVPPRYQLHPLVRAYAAAKMEQYECTDFESEARGRWVDYYVGLTKQVGSCWNQIEKLNLLDPEHETVYSVIEWCFNNGRYKEVCQLAKQTRYYFYVRGFWDKRLLVDEKNREVAQRLSDPIEEAKALAYYLQIVLRRHNIPATRDLLPRLRDLAKAVHLPDGIRSIYHQTEAMYLMANEKYAAAQEEWELGLCSSDERNRVSIQRWIAKCLYKRGELKEAREQLEKNLSIAHRQGYVRSIALHYVDLARIDLEMKELSKASDALEQCERFLSKLDCPAVGAERHLLLGRLYRLQEKKSQAADVLEKASIMCKQTGLQIELKEASKELRELFNDSSNTSKYGDLL